MHTVQVSSVTDSTQLPLLASFSSNLMIILMSPLNVKVHMPILAYNRSTLAYNQSISVYNWLNLAVEWAVYSTDSY